MIYNPDIHHRRSIRLKEFDYSSVGAYFVTVCVQGRECLFGEIRDGKMGLNDAGRMVNQWWLKLPEKFPHAALDEYVIMPNHFHGIIFLNHCINDIGRRGEPCVRPDFHVRHRHDVLPDFHVQPGLDVLPDTHPEKDGIKNTGDHKNVGDNQKAGDHPNRGDHKDRPYGTHIDSLGRVVQAFKSLTTVEYIRGVKERNWPPFHGRLWQRNYYERVIRSDAEISAIREYICFNPSKWSSDQENPQCTYVYGDHP